MMLGPHPQTAADDQLYRCPGCGLEKPLAAFNIRAGRKTFGKCKPCIKDYDRRKREERAAAAGKPVPRRNSAIDHEGRKHCLYCEQWLSLDRFIKWDTGLGGVTARCKECTRRYVLARPNHREEARQATKAYRERHRPRALAKHRLHQLKRRSKIKAHDDGTVTDEFLAALYATTHCAYCHTETPPDQRTADHKTPLTRGGWHSASNLTMACRSCNSSKGSRTVDEFRYYLECLSPPKSLPTVPTHSTAAPTA